MTEFLTPTLHAAAQFSANRQVLVVARASKTHGAWTCAPQVAGLVADARRGLVYSLCSAAEAGTRERPACSVASVRTTQGQNPLRSQVCHDATAGQICLGCIDARYLDEKKKAPRLTSGRRRWADGQRHPLPQERTQQREHHQQISAQRPQPMPQPAVAMAVACVENTRLD